MAYIYNLTDTWNAAGTAFNGIKMAVTNTASAASSYLLNLTASGATTASFTVDKSGNMAASGVAATIGYQGASGIVTTDATTTRTLSASDNGKVLYFTSGSAITVTTASGLGAGFSCLVIQGGAGQVTIAQGASTTLVSNGSLTKTATQYSVISVICPVADTFLLAGALGA